VAIGAGKKTLLASCAPVIVTGGKSEKSVNYHEYDPDHESALVIAEEIEEILEIVIGSKGIAVIARGIEDSAIGTEDNVKEVGVEIESVVMIVAELLLGSFSSILWYLWLYHSSSNN